MGTYESYFFDVVDWELSHAFSTGGEQKYREEACWEHVELEIVANCISPEKFAGDETRIHIMGDRDLDSALDDPDNFAHEPLSIGSLTLRGDIREYLGSMPQSALDNLARSLETGRSKAIQLYGSVLKYGTAKITSIYFTEEHDPDHM